MPPFQSIPVPQRVAERISRRAVQIARLNAPKRTGAGALSLKPMRRRGEVGILVPEDYGYMLYQEYGIRSFVMWGIIGGQSSRVIPLRLRDGTMIYRTATLENIGRRRIISRDERGRILSTKLTWWHPGLPPRLFMHKAIVQAIQEWVRDTPPEDLNAVLSEVPALREFMQRIGGVELRSY